MDDGIAHVASQVRAALDGGDLDRFADLLDPQVTWGAPGDPAPPCRNRQQVLTWYQRGRAAGQRARVRDVVTNGDKILVRMTVSPAGSTPDDAEQDRWQVLTVVDGRVSDIRGYDDEAAAQHAAGLLD